MAITVCVFNARLKMCRNSSRADRLPNRRIQLVRFSSISRPAGLDHQRPASEQRRLGRGRCLVDRRGRRLKRQCRRRRRSGSTCTQGTPSTRSLSGADPQGRFLHGLNDVTIMLFTMEMMPSMPTLYFYPRGIWGREFADLRGHRLSSCGVMGTSV